jgi:hypothetical protein
MSLPPQNPVLAYRKNRVRSWTVEIHVQSTWLCCWPPQGASRGLMSLATGCAESKADPTASQKDHALLFVQPEKGQPK